MTRKKTLGILIFTLILVIAIARINKTLLPAFKPVFNRVDTKQIEKMIPLGETVSITTNDTFLKSDENLGVTIFAKNLESPRALIFDDFGRLIVSSNKSNNVIRLDDSNKVNFVENHEILLANQDRPHGVLLHDGYLYVAEEETVKRYAYNKGTLGPEEFILRLPKGGRHFTRSLATANDKLYVSIGSSCDTCIEYDNRYASVMELNFDGSDVRIYASGLRNAVFIKTHPKTGELFATEMGRDHLGDNLPPDEINIIKQGEGYGWPFCYGKQIYDTVFAGVNNCSLSKASLIDLPAHAAPLGFAFIPDSWGSEYAGDLLVAMHGSWNSTKPVGYSVMRFNRIDNGFEEKGTIFLSGFLNENGGALGRPVDLVFDKQGTLFMSDDKAGLIYAIQLLKN